MDFLPKEEQISLKLRELYHNRGYVLTRPNRFEDYSLLLTNKNFLDTETIITFMDAAGRLTSLKPDVTLSIINALPEEPGTRRIAYADEVYRFSKAHGDYRTLRQVGVELVAPVDRNDETDREIIALALETLGIVSDKFILCVSGASDALLAKFEHIRADKSLKNDLDYYNGLIFRGYAEGFPDSVLSGGRYDNLCAKLGKNSGATGFAVTLNGFSENTGVYDEEYLAVALPKGRLAEKIRKKTGFSGDFDGRKLIITDERNLLKYFLVKPSDVCVYIENGVADVGICGGDTLMEHRPNVSEICDLGFGRCKIVVAAPKGFRDDPAKLLRVATKFPEITKKYYGSRPIRIIKLNGSVEIAPLLGLSDVITDIVETGSTLRANNMEVIAEISPVSARLAANRASVRFKSDKIRKFKELLNC